MLNAVLVAAHILISVLLIVLILMHSGKDAGMASSSGFSFASQASVMERNLTRYTVITAILFFISTFILAWRLG